MNQFDNELMEKYISAYFLYGYENPEALIKWLLDDKYPEKIECRESLKRALREALDVPGTVTPFTFRCWTDNHELDTQDLVQQLLQKLWDACFEGKVIEDWGLDVENGVAPDEAQT